MSERGRDLSFEALAEVCGVDLTALNTQSRGALNKALALIRESTSELEDAELAIVIPAKARAYRKVMRKAMLTPTALAKHWPQLDALLAEQEAPVTYVTNDGVYCSTCGGDKMIFHSTTPSVPSVWALEHRDKRHPHLGAPHPAHRSPEDGHDVWMPCPDCNQKGLEKVREYNERFARVHGRRPAPPTEEALAAMRAVVRT